MKNLSKVLPYRFQSKLVFFNTGEAG